MRKTFIPNSMIRFTIALAFLVTASSSLAAATNSNTSKAAPIETLDTVVAVVNDQVITASQLSDQESMVRKQLQSSHTPLPAENVLRHQILERMIDQSLQLQVAKTSGISVGDDAVDQAIGRIAQQNHLTTDQLRTQLNMMGLNYDQYRSNIRDQMTISQLQDQEVAGSIVITPQEISDMMNVGKINNVSENPMDTQMAEYHLKDILIALPDSPTPDQEDQAKKTAVTLLAKLKQGGDFSQAAVAQSQDQNALQGGDLGWRKLAEMPDPFVAYVKTMQPGDLAGPIRTPNGFHIIKLIEIRGLNNASTAQSQTITESHVRQILIKTNPLLTDDQLKDRASNVRDDIIAGEDFAKAAEVDSQDPNSATHGGDLGWVAPGTLPSELDAAIPQLKLNQISQPIKSAQGWYLIEVIGTRQQTLSNKDYLTAQIRQMIYKRKFNEAIQNWVQQLRGQSYIKIVGESTPNATSPS